MPRNPKKTDWSGGLPSCFAPFSVIEDPRTVGNKLHYSGGVLFMAASAMLDIAHLESLISPSLIAVTQTSQCIRLQLTAVFDSISSRSSFLIRRSE